jgi:PRTRC genetic system protein A
VRRPWLQLLWPITEDGAINPALPYGDVKRSMSFLFGKLPRELMVRFLAEAKKQSPFEHAAWIVWDATRAAAGVPRPRHPGVRPGRHPL